MIFICPSQIHPLPFKIHYILMSQPSPDVSALWHIRQPFASKITIINSILIADFSGAIPHVKDVKSGIAVMIGQGRNNFYFFFLINI